MFVKVAKICILMFAIEAFFVFGDDANVNAKELHVTEHLAEAEAAAATTTTTAATPTITTTELPTHGESKLKFESSSAIESTTATAATTTATATPTVTAIKTETITTTLATTTTIKNDLSSAKDIVRRTLSLNNATVKPEMVAESETLVEEAEMLTSETAMAMATATATTTTSTATPTTTATTSTTTTTMMTPHELEEIKRAAEHAWQRFVQAGSGVGGGVSKMANGNEAGTNQKQQQQQQQQQQHTLEEQQATIAGVAANTNEQKQQQPTATTKLMAPETDATETPVMVHATTTTTTTAAPTTTQTSVTKVENANKKLITNENDDNVDFDVVAAITAAPSLAATPATATTTTEATTTITTTTDATPELLLPTINAFMQIESKVYQVPETLASDSEANDDDGDEYVAGNSDGRISHNAAGRSKLNIVDLYPMKIEDFKPIIRDSNERLLKERTIFKQPPDAEEYRQNLIPNEVELLTQELQQQQQQQQTTKSVNRATPTAMGETISDFTGKLLAEQDGVITEIEQKFRLNDEFQQSSAATTATTATTTATSKSATSTVQTATTDVTAATDDALPMLRATQRDHRHTFIDRRVKKSFDFPMHRVASDVMSMPHIDFANTKFNTDIAAAAAVTGANQNGGGIHGERETVGGNSKSAAAAAMASAMHPEFSTTKFYNSKELYNEMLLHNKRKLMKASTVSGAGGVATTVMPGGGSGSNIMKSIGTSGMTTSRAKLKSSAASFADSSDLRKLATATTAASATTTAHAAAAIPTTTMAPTGMPRRVTITPTMPASTSTLVTRSRSFDITTTTTTPPATATTTTEPLISNAQALKPKKYQKELKRAKLLLKAMLPTNAAATNANTEMGATVKSTTKPKPTKTDSETHSTSSTTQPTGARAGAEAEVATSSSTSLPLSQQQLPPLPSTVSSLLSVSSSSSSPVLSSLSSLTNEQRLILNPPKSASKPIARPRILSRLQEKINSLECEIQNVPQDSHLWRGNETHELLLPIVTTEHCRNLEQHLACTPNVVSWEGEAEIQSGDILIVEINDAMLNPNEHENFTSSAHAAQVYQVTRSGHEHCDVTEGILLDITPLVVDGRKLVTLYDKDLTEGVNLLIVVSELWGTQCVRLKVTTKTDNCGENADCSGKGVCYSNTAMEEYECQCCSGFAGPHCEEIDACNPSPCTNNGICVDLSQGHEGNSYQCLCPYGYTGKNCQYESDPCNPAECMNGGSCVGNSTHFRCDCTPGYAGPLCQHSLNECESSPCVHGICVDQEDGFRCFCQPGFAGELCNFEYNECESNPCQNGGECIDHIGSYECRCTKGYTGNRCQIKVDFCANKPCPEGQRCIDHGNDFSCECPGGRNGPDCNQMPRTYFQQCNVNPCTHGGTCWSSGDSFYCACRPGFTGTMCEDEFVVETVVSSSEFIVDDTSARNFNDKTFGSSVVLKSPIELHNAYFAAGVLAAAIFIVAVVVTICHCKVNQTYRKFSTRTTTFFPILGFSRRPKMQSKLNKHWLSGKGIGTGGSGSGTGGGGGNSTGSLLRSSASASSATSTRHLPQPNPAGGVNAQTGANPAAAAGGRQLHERPFQRHLAMNLENDMYYTVDFSENSQHSPLIQ